VVPDLRNYQYGALSSLAVTPNGRAEDSSGPARARAKARLKQDTKVPIVFEKNQGQWDPQVRFAGRWRGAWIFFTDASVTMSMPEAEPEPATARGEKRERDFLDRRDRRPRSWTVTNIAMRFAGAAGSTRPVGLDPLPGKSHYLRGTDPSKNITNVSQYQRVEYKSVYPGIDLVFHSRDGRLEYDFAVAAGADPEGIDLEFDGMDELRADDTGDLVLKTRRGEIRHRAPNAFSEGAGERRAVQSGYRVQGKRVGFHAKGHDRRRALRIDPVIDYTTVLGGSDADFIEDMTVDALGNAFVCGSTRSVDFPETPGTLPGAAGRVGAHGWCDRVDSDCEVTPYFPPRAHFLT